MIVTFGELGNYGRMGNALFQISATIGYALKYNIPYIFPKWEHQDYFQIPKEHFQNKSDIKFSLQYDEPSYSYNEIPLQNQNCSLYGYFQSWKYFAHCQDFVRDMLSPAPVENLHGYCCVHVRRGDYLRYPNHHPIPSIDYYMAAVKKIPVQKFMVFSDDIEWCKAHFKDSRFTINETSSLVSDMRKMISCSHFIIANSSFSWWTAWLCRNKHKAIVAPKNWFGPALNETHPIKDLIPNEWMLL